MAAPADTTRSTPAGKQLEVGHPIKIAFARDPDVSFWEHAATPPSVDGGDEIEITTMFNTAWRTFAPAPLKTLGEFSATVGYDPDVYAQIIELINEPGAITVHFPDGSKLSFFGYLKSFEPGEGNREDNPEADITIFPTQYDPVARVEAAPVLTAVPGT